MSDREPPTRSRGVIGRSIGGLVNRATPTVLDILDVDLIIEHLDLDALIAHLDVNAVAGQLDLDALMERLDLDALIAHLDVNAVAGQLDLDALMERIDLDQIVARLDVNTIAEQLDLDSLVGRIAIVPLVGKSSSEFAEGGLDLARRQLIRLDVIVTAVTTRVIRRDPATVPLGPGLGPVHELPPDPPEAAVVLDDPDAGAESAGDPGGP